MDATYILNGIGGGRVMQSNGDNFSNDGIPRDQTVILNMLFWNLLALVLLLVYLVIQRPCFPRFVLLRRLPFSKDRLGEEENQAESSLSFVRRAARTLKRVFVDPLRMLFLLSEHELIHHCGLDGYVTIRTLRFCLRTVFLVCIMNLIVLTPTYRYQVQPAECTQYCSMPANPNNTNDDAFQAQCVCNWIDKCSMANIPIGSGMLWFPAVFMLLNTVLVLDQIEREYRQLVRVRREFWRSFGENRLHSIFIEYIHLPRTTAATRGQESADAAITRPLKKPATIADHVQRLFPNDIHRIEMFSTKATQLLRKMGGVAHNRIRALMRLEHAIKVRENHIRPPRKWRCLCPCRKSPTIHVDQSSRDGRNTEARINETNGWRYLCCFGFVERVDSVRFYRSRLDELNRHFQRLRRALDKPQGRMEDDDDGESLEEEDRIKSGKYEGYQFAFVTFTNAQKTAEAAQTLLHHDMHVQVAPDPNDVRWDSLLKKVNRRDSVAVMRMILSRLLFAVILVFWGTITSFIGAVTSLDALSQQIPALHDLLVNNPVAYAWLQRLVALIYSIIVGTASPIISWSVTLETHRISDSQVERAVMRRYFTFLVIQVFIFYSIAGSVLKTIVEIINNPSEIVNTLSSTIPKNASFFIMFMAVQTFWKMIDLVRVYSLLYELLRWIAYGRTVTPREARYQACGCCWHYLFPSPMGIAGTNANNLLMIFITVCYSVIQPFVTLAAFFYFVGANISYTFQFIHASRQIRDGAGQFWPYSFWCIIFGLYTAHLTLIGTLLIKQGFFQAIFVAVTCCVTTFLWSNYMHGRYHRRFMLISLDLARDVDDQSSSHAAVSAAPDGEVTRESVPPIIDTLCQPMMRYNHVLGDFDQEDCDEDEEAQWRKSRDRKGIHVYRYAHPVLYEREEVQPDTTLIDFNHLVTDPVTGMADSIASIASSSANNRTNVQNNRMGRTGGSLSTNHPGEASVQPA